jgi:hypothetical protein
MIKILRDCRAGRNITMDCGDPYCCNWMEYDGFHDFFIGDEIYESEIVIEDLEEGIDYVIIH